MKNFFFSFLMFASAWGVVLPATAYDFEHNGIYYNVNADGVTVSVTYAPGYSSYSGSVSVPRSIVYGGESYRVTAVGSNAFFGCEDLVSLTLPEGIVLIDDYGVYSCGVVSVTLPASVTTIGECAFAHCWYLESIVIPEGVVSIGDDAFANTGLTSVTLPESVRSLGYTVFGHCDDLEAFYGKWASDDHRCLIVNDTLKCFAPAGLTEYAIPDGVVCIDEEAFEETENLTSVTIPGSVVSIESLAFHMSGLTSIVIPDGVEFIGSSAFSECRYVTSITIGSGVKEIEERAFDCGGITGDNSEMIVTVYAREPIVIEDLYNTPFPYADMWTLYVPAESVELYKAADMWKDFKEILPIDGSGVDAVAADAIVCRVACDGTLAVEGVAAGMCVELFDMSGATVRQVTASGERVEIVLPARGAYLVRVAGNTHKILF